MMGTKYESDIWYIILNGNSYNCYSTDINTRIVLLIPYSGEYNLFYGLLSQCWFTNIAKDVFTSNVSAGR